MTYGPYNSPFGTCWLVFDQETLHAITFALSEEQAKEEISPSFGKYSLQEDAQQAKKLGDAIFIHHKLPQIKVKGTDFQKDVWKELLKIPRGETRTYADIARAVGRPKAFRAVGSAVGQNPIAYLIPCHRVIRTDGGLGGYHWGIDFKIKMLKAEGLGDADFLRKVSE